MQRIFCGRSGSIQSPQWSWASHNAWSGSSLSKLFFVVNLLYYYYYYHFTAPWISSGTTQVSRYQKGKMRKVKPIWIYREQEIVSGSGISLLYANLLCMYIILHTKQCCWCLCCFWFCRGCKLCVICWQETSSVTIDSLSQKFVSCLQLQQDTTVSTVCR